LREGGRTRKAEEMVRTNMTTIRNMPLRNKMGDILLARKWSVIPSLFKKEKKKKRQDFMKKGSCVQHFFPLSDVDDSSGLAQCSGEKGGNEVCLLGWILS